MFRSTYIPQSEISHQKECNEIFDFIFLSGEKPTLNKRKAKRVAASEVKKAAKFVQPKVRNRKPVAVNVIRKRGLVDVSDVKSSYSGVVVVLHFYGGLVRKRVF